jgi:hypothetical protein
MTRCYVNRDFALVVGFTSTVKLNMMARLQFLDPVDVEIVTGKQHNKGR